MDIFFADPSEVPLPPDEMHIRKITTNPFPDGRRVRVNVELDPFQRKPNVDLVVKDPEGRELITTSIIESISRHIEIVMHLPAELPSNVYQLHATLFYFKDDEGIADGEAQLQRWVIDSAQVEFTANVES